jgi:phosphopantetheine adenylyltransferase
MASDGGPPLATETSKHLIHQRIIVAGTFDVLHDGHFALLHSAFARGRHVEVWVTDDALGAAKAAKTGQIIQSYATRCEHVAAWCDAQTPTSIAHFIDVSHPSMRDVLPEGLHDPEAVVPLPAAPSDSEAAASRRAGDGTAATPDPCLPYRGRYSLHELHDSFGPSVTDPAYTGIVCSEETLPGCRLINEIRAGKGMPPLQIVVAPLVWDAARDKKLSSTDLRAARAALQGRADAPTHAAGAP